MYLGIDLGTSGVKVIVMDENQHIIASETAPLEVSRPHSGWSEQDADSWIAATDAAISGLKHSHPQAISAVKGIGLSGQMHGATFVGKDGHALRPCMLWNDTRSYQEAAQFDADPQFREISGNIVFPGFTAPKVEWVRKNEPDIFAKTDKILLPKDYLRLWLTGEYVSDMSDAAGTAWLDVEKRCWSADLLSACHLTQNHMPSLVEGSDSSGYLRSQLAAKWGIVSACVVAGGAGDNAASACGMGTVQAGQAFASLGTSGVLFAANASYLPNPESAVHTFCHALPNTWHQMGVILSATDALNWLSSITGQKASALTSNLGDTLIAPGMATFLPYLSGERTPHNDAQIRGSLTGLEHGTDQVALTRAVLEGVSFAFRDCLEALGNAGTELTRVTAVGGGSRSDYWLKCLATALDLPIELTADGDYGAGFGAARLGMIAATSADPFAICTAPAITRTIEPAKDLREDFDAAYGRYRALYPALKGI